MLIITDIGSKDQVAVRDQDTELRGGDNDSYPDLPSGQPALAALVDQQKEIMRYMRGLEKWMERERTTNSELLESLNERLEQLKAPLHSKLNETGGLAPSLNKINKMNF